ncbi:unnamed protein product, partial [Amoebophrya sp. A120]
ARCQPWPRSIVSRPPPPRPASLGVRGPVAAVFCWFLGWQCAGGALASLLRRQRRGCARRLPRSFGWRPTSAPRFSFASAPLVVPHLARCHASGSGAARPVGYERTLAINLVSVVACRIAIFILLYIDRRNPARLCLRASDRT